MKDARHILFRDIETRSTLDLTGVGAWRYAGDPNTAVWCVAYAIDDGPARIWIPGQVIPEEFHTAARDSNWVAAAHNDAFERAIEELVLVPRFDWPLVPIERHRCTMAAALASALPGSLEGAAEALGLPGKDTEGAHLMRLMAKPRKPRAGEDPNGIYWHDDPEKLERLYTYCRNDVEVERALFHQLPTLADLEQALWALDATINRFGFHTDGPLLEAASRIAAAAGQAVQEELTRITAGALTSTDQVAALITWLGEHGCEVKNLRKPTLKHALRRKELDPIARRVIELRLGAAHAAAAKIDTLRAWRDADGRIRGTLRYHGAGTGRWTGHGPQPQNFKRDGEDVEAKLAAVATGDLARVQELYPQPLEIVGDIARAMICAAPGHRLLIGDFSGIESRVTAWVSGQQSKLDQWAKFDRTNDPKDEPYYILGRSCGRPEESARKIGKTADLAFGYMGGPAAWDRLAPEDDSSNEEDKRRYQQTWRSLHPQTVQFWYGIDRIAIAAIRKPNTSFTYKRFTLTFDGTFLRIVLPSGRALSYPFPRLETGKYGHPMVMFKDNAAGKWVDCRYGQGAYGGLWTENIVQAVSRDLLAAAMMRLEAAGYRVVLHVHDEIVAEVPDGFGSVEEFQRLITALPDWAEGLAIAAKVRNGERFSKPQKPTAANAIPDDLDDNEDKPGGKFVAGAGRHDHAGVHAGFHAHAGDHDDQVGQHANDHGDPTDPDGDTAGRDGNGAGAKSFNGSGAESDNNDDDYASGERRTGRTVETYIYKDAAGRNYHKVERTSTKQFPQSVWTGRGWQSGAPKIKLTYRLPELIKAEAEAWVFICEGEKDAGNVTALGLVATTNPGGAGKWVPELNQWFIGKQNVCICEDNDDAGRAHARKVAGSLQGIVANIRIVSFPELPAGGDVSDWLAMGHTRNELLALAEAAPRATRALPFIDMSRWDFEPTPEQEWAVYNRIPRRQCVLFSGEGATGKSTEQLHLSAASALGRDWIGWQSHRPARCSMHVARRNNSLIRLAFLQDCRMEYPLAMPIIWGYEPLRPHHLVGQGGVPKTAWQPSEGCANERG
jgi:DNA polymerase bacteriophage-type